MILTSVRIENFKQYGGAHDIAIRDSGLVAVIGANGAGKTTLFEAVEWCLYKPNTLPNRVVRTRNGSGPTRVAVRIANPVSGVCYVVERRLLKSGAVEAFVWQEDQPDSRLANGTGEVTSYVARHLIGLSHKAFIATFFTRQKELSFFGALGPTERRREVAKLLGHDAIADAGGIMKTEADAAANAAQVALQVHRAASEGRDFDAELRAAETGLSAASEAFDAEVIRHRQTDERLAAVNTELAAAREDERKHRGLQQRLTELDGQHNLAAQQEGTARGQLAALDEEERKRPGLEAVAAGEPERLAAVLAQEQELERDRERGRLDSELRRIAGSETTLAGDLKAAVDAAPAPFPVAGWSIPERPSPVADEARRLLAVIDALPLDDAAAAEQRIAGCRQAADARDLAAASESGLRDQLESANTELARMRDNGDPSVLLAAAGEARDRLRAEYADVQAREKHLATTIKDAREQSDILRRFDHEQACPTCLRPYSADEAHKQIGINEALITHLQPDLDQARARLADLAQRGAESGNAVKALEARVRDVAVVETRIRETGARLAAAEAARAEREATLRQALAAAGLATEPDEVAARAARERLAALNRIAASRQAVDRVLRDALAAIADRQRISSERQSLGPSSYDAAAHAAADAALQEARAASVQLRAIGERLANRPRHEQELQAALGRQAEIDGLRAEARAAIVSLAFNPAALADLEARSAEAAAEERTAFVSAQRAEQAVSAATAARLAVIAERDSVAGLADAANRRLREADDLARMRDGLRAFEKYVAERVQPILADRTSEFLSLVTDGQYGQVEFDSDYGLSIFDEDRAFPVADFSGGERDVASLCARLALSSIVGDQAAHPPGFVVLDEVFGSLDQERRALLLDTLSSLTGSGHLLQQLFVISHVEEVNASPLVDEVWRVTAANGLSKLEQDPRDGTIQPDQAGRLLLGDE